MERREKKGLVADVSSASPSPELPRKLKHQGRFFQVDKANPGLVKFFISISDPATSMS